MTGVLKVARRLLRRCGSSTEATQEVPPSERGWPQDIYERLARDEILALDLLDLVNSSEKWLHRRVEAVDFYHNTTAAYRVSLDFTVPAEAPLVNYSGGTPIRLLPLTMLAKRPLANFDVRDETGQPLPVLTTDQNARLAHQMLMVWGQGILDAPMPYALDELLNKIVRCKVAEGPEAYEQFENRPLPGAEQERLVLLRAAEEMFAALVDDLSEHFILMVLLTAESGDRRVVKLSYDQAYEAGPDASFRRGLADRLGWAASSTAFQAVGPINAESHHFEVVKPNDVEIVDLTITRTPGEFQRFETGGAHVHAHLGRLQEGERVEVTVGLLPERRGWLRGCWVSALAITALLLFLAFHIDVLIPERNSAPAEAVRSGAPLLLAVAGLAASLLGRPREHALATDLLIGLRWVAGVPPACAFVLAAVLTVGPDSPARLPWLAPMNVDVTLTWWILTGLSALAAFVVSIAMRPRARVTPAE